MTTLRGIKSTINNSEIKKDNIIKKENIDNSSNPSNILSSSNNNVRKEENLLKMFTGSESDLNNNRVSVVKLSTVFLTVLLCSLPQTVLSQQRNYVSIFNRSNDRRELSPYKGYSGIRVRPDAIRMVYYHDQTVAVVEVGSDREMYNCELIEIYNQQQADELLQNLTAEIGVPVPLSFVQITDLMENCKELELPDNVQLLANDIAGGFARSHSTVSSSIFKGILPGTKWCGSGDLAETYFDLGTEKELDKCCRNHDICPSKVRPSTTKYNLTNSALFTKSHCTCDLKFLQCLKKTKNPTANLMGNFYFNLLHVPCLDLKKHRFRSGYRY